MESYLKVPKKMIGNEMIKPIDVLTYCIITQNVDEFKIAKLNNSSLSSDLGISERSVQRSLQRLNDAGFIRLAIKGSSRIIMIDSKSELPDGFKLKEEKNSNVKDIKEREEDFVYSVYKYCKEHNMPEYIAKEFCDYWTEPNKSRTKMRFENEKSWDLKRRINRWVVNSNRKFKRNNNNGMVY